MQTALPVRLGSHENLRGLAATRSGRIVLVLSANVLMAICAHVSLPLFFTPVPLTLQTFAVILTGLLLGPSLAFSTMLLYLAEGAMGLPVFSPAGLGGFAQLFGYTSGFLVSYPFAAAASGLVVRAIGIRRPQFGAAVLAGICATIITLISGGLWIAGISHAGLETATTIGIVPFLPGEVIKIIAAAAAFVALGRYARS